MPESTDECARWFLLQKVAGDEVRGLELWSRFAMDLNEIGLHKLV